MNRSVSYSVSPLTGLKTLLAALCLVFGLATSPPAAEAENNEIEIHQKNIAAIEKKEMAVIDDLHDISYTLSSKKKKVAALKSAIQDIENKIDHNTSRSQALAREIQEKKTYASRRIVALYKLYQLGKLNYLASADSITDVCRQTLLR